MALSVVTLCNLRHHLPLELSLFSFFTAQKGDLNGNIEIPHSCILQIFEGGINVHNSLHESLLIYCFSQ